MALVVAGKPPIDETALLIAEAAAADLDSDAAFASEADVVVTVEPTEPGINPGVLSLALLVVVKG